MENEKFEELIERSAKMAAAIVAPQVAQERENSHNAGKIFENSVDKKMMFFENKFEIFQLEMKHLVQTELGELKHIFKDEYAREIEEFEKRISENSKLIKQNSEDIKSLKKNMLRTGHMLVVYLMIGFLFVSMCIFGVVHFKKESKTSEVFYRIEQLLNENQRLIEANRQIIDEFTQKNE